MAKTSILILGSYSLAAFVILSILGCSDQNGYQNIQDYYFPARALSEGLVYEYHFVGNDSIAPNYWYYQSVPTDSSALLTGMFYEADLLPRQFIQESINQDGATLQTLRFFEPDSIGPQRFTEASITGDDVFPFLARPNGGVYIYEVNFKMPSDSLTDITLTRNRQFLGDTTIVFQGKTLDAIRFKVRERALFNHPTLGGIEQDYSGQEVYARGVGLVYYDKQVSEDFTLAYELADRYPMTELEALYESLRQRE